MALPNTIEVKFIGNSSGLTKAIKSLDVATKSLVKAQASQANEGKKQVQSQNKNKNAIKSLNIALAMQGSNWKKAGISAKMYSSAVKGNRLDLAKVRLATKKHIIDLKRQKRGLLDTAHSTRILGGSFAVLRSKMLLVSFAFTLIGMTVGKLVKASNKQEKAEKKLAQALKSTGHAAGLSHKQLLLMASGLQAVTTHGDEAIIEAQTLMLTFTNINKEVFPQALESILNVSDAMGQDLKQSTIQLGKALNDPVQGMSALRRIGIQLSDTQKEQVKSFMAVNDVASAQKIIIKELDVQFGGMARATRLTLAGSLTALANSWGDAMEKMGEKLTPFITALTGSLESITTIMQSEGERQLAFLGKIGASEKTIKLATIRLLKEEAKERLKSIDSTNIDLNRTDTLNKSYQEQVVILVAMRDNLALKEKALLGSTDALMGAVETSEGFNQALNDGESALNGFGKSLTTGGFSLGANMKAILGVNTEMGKKVVLDKEAVEVLKVQVAKQIEANTALADYMRSLGLLPDLLVKVEPEILAQIKVIDIAKAAMTSFGEALVPGANVGDAFRKFVANYLSLIQGVILASGAMSGALSMAWVPGLGVTAAIAALAALEAAKVAVMNVKFAEHGFEGFVDRPTLFMTGEAGREHVQITPVDRPEDSALGNGITVNIMGGIVQEDYVTNELLPAINKARALA